MRKSLKIIVVLMIVLALLIPYTISYGTDDDTDFFEVASEEISTLDLIEGTLNIENVSYDKFIFSLESTSDISEIKIVEDEESEDTDIPKITVESENKITIEFDKTENDLTQIVLQCSLPDNIVSGDTITLIATVTNSEDEEESESIEITVSVINETDEDEDSAEISDEATENVESSGYNEFSSLDNNNFDMNTDNSDFSSMSSDSSFSLGSSFDTSGDDFTSKSSSSVNFSSSLTEETVTYNGSDNNYLSELSITSYGLNKTFSKENTTYFVTVDSSVESIEINATAEDDGATVCIYGDSSLSTGENKVLITVTAENGNTRTYRVYVTKN